MLWGLRGWQATPRTQTSPLPDLHNTGDAKDPKGAHALWLRVDRCLALSINDKMAEEGTGR